MPYTNDNGRTFNFFASEVEKVGIDMWDIKTGVGIEIPEDLWMDFFTPVELARLGGFVVRGHHDQNNMGCEVSIMVHFPKGTIPVIGNRIAVMRLTPAINVYLEHTDLPVISSSQIPETPLPENPEKKNGIATEPVVKRRRRRRRKKNKEK